MFLKNYVRETSLFLLALSGVLLLNSCGGEKKADETTAVDTAATMTEDTTAVEPTATSPILSALPKTSDIPATIQLTGADFNQSLINPSSKVASYTTTNDKAALNLGAYATDIGYLSVYKKTQDVLTYLKGAQKLSDHLGLSNAFGEAMQKRFQSNLATEDSLVKIVDESMLYVRKYLADNQRDATGALVVTGSFVEGLYISTGLIKKYPKDVPADVRNGVLTQLILDIIKQKQSLADLITILKSVKQDEAVVAYTQKLNDLYGQFEALKFEESLKSNAGNFAVTDKTLTEITKKVEAIRADIVK
ncbi:hypothetical protein [Xanthocytophaga flava]|uniref:hypothetical protein n=1 Tax=Xanthocytophaga flava TaxID=3048013 RepID=UPI0028D13461|nr:hypothetical protein [Xanthocytophaga flavus]MDJ1471660.1 hypothetical protein [Xanthocytophaga flavus]